MTYSQYGWQDGTTPRNARILFPPFSYKNIDNGDLRNLSEIRIYCSGIVKFNDYLKEHPELQEYLDKIKEDKKIGLCNVFSTLIKAKDHLYINHDYDEYLG